MSIGEQLTGVFTDMSEWITTSLGSFTSIFYNAESGLTFLGWMSLAALGMAVALLLFNIVRSIIRFH